MVRSSRKSRTKRHAPLQKTRAELIAEFDALPNDTRLTETYVAAKRGCSVALLQRERVYGSPIAFLREGGQLRTDKNGQARIFGGRIYYLKRDVLDYLALRNRTVRSTAAFSADIGSE